MRIYTSLRNALAIIHKRDWLWIACFNAIVVVTLIILSFVLYDGLVEGEYQMNDTADIEEKQYMDSQLMRDIQVKTGLNQEISRKIIEQAEQYEHLSVELILSVMLIESTYQADAVSGAGAIGIMQVMPNTGQWLAEKLGKSFQAELLFDPIYNMELGCFYLNDLMERYGDLHTALTAYNRGETGMEQYRQMHERTISSYSLNVIQQLNNAEKR
ncbi:hypothetical protein BHU72_06785 [Desulfuribacillus stibiiarsenatis]|uniref:Transglycosylase SLT domain-containing protein n=1 Tax=Desulfuribacillus stibiiarsenatis TaxID=1390249 RepID=A0A1E5L482_9FIRM|nr:lytic transglycosylase domain-containing protein [Desulfuribacillus stibiiarsenatis]OEH84894.1 hypothetical protein BHU72_06785 [Desulfuribacillus stibiiarsenatis]